MTESLKFTVKFKDQDSGEWTDGGVHSFAIRPTVGEYMRITASHGATHLHQIIAFVHPDHITLTCGELFLVDVGEEGSVLDRLQRAAKV